MPWQGTAAPTAERILHLGCHRGHAAQPVPLPAHAARACRRCPIIGAMSFFAVLFALLIEQLKPLPRDNWVHDTLLPGCAGPAATSTPASRTTPGWCGACRCWCRRAGRACCTCHCPLQPAAGAGLRRGAAVPDAGLPPVQPLLHRHPRRAGPRRREPGAPLLAEWRHLDASELPRTEVLRHVIEHALLAAHRHVFGVFFWFVVLSALGLGPMGAVLYRMAEFSSRYWGYRQRALDAPANDACWPCRAGCSSGSTMCRRADGLRLCGGRQLRGGHRQLAA
jgi:hypothetical protein